MIESRVLAVQAVADLRDRLEWEVQVSFPRYTETGTDTVTYFDWEGDIAFYLDPLAAGSLGPHPNPKRRSLAARWEAPLRAIGKEAKAFEGQSVALQFSTEVDTRTLERLEAFRAGGRFYARIEGRMNLIYASRFDQQLPAGGMKLRHTIASESFELPLPQWCEEILPKLLPPGKFVLEVDCSEGLAETSNWQRLDRARKAFYESRFDHMVADLYSLLEQAPAVSPIDDKDRLRGSLKNVHRGVRELLNLYRHHNPDVPPLTRPLARFLLLAVMQSDVFRSVAPGEGG